MAPPTSRQSPGKGTGPRPTGILPIPASATQKRNPAQTDSMSTRIAAPRLKLVIRRLPPALTEAEFEAALGDDWKVNGGKVDWVVYKAGKTSKEYSGSKLELILRLMNLVLLSCQSPLAFIYT